MLTLPKVMCIKDITNIASLANYQRKKNFPINCEQKNETIHAEAGIYMLLLYLFTPALNLTIITYIFLTLLIQPNYTKPYPP